MQQHKCLPRDGGGPSRYFEHCSFGAYTQAACVCWVQVHGRGLSIPGRAIGAVLDKLKDGLPKESHTLLVDFHAGVVASLRGQSQAEGAGQAAAVAKLQEQLEAVKVVAGVGAAEPQSDAPKAPPSSS